MIAQDENMVSRAKVAKARMAMVAGNATLWKTSFLVRFIEDKNGRLRRWRLSIAMSGEAYSSSEAANFLLFAMEVPPRSVEAGFVP